MTQYGFSFNSDKCTGCKTCQVACKETWQLPEGLLYRTVYDYEGGSWKQTEAGYYVPDGVFGYFVSMACNHCSAPACVAACPTGAMQKDEDTGIVWTDHEVCIGCGACAAACPYGAPKLYKDKGYSVKCDMCKSELALSRKPVCVGACPMRALDWGPIEELRERYGNGNVDIEPFPAQTTGPNIVLIPHRMAKASGTGEGRIANLPEELA